MKTVDISEATDRLAAYARRVRREPLIVTKDGRPMMAVVRLQNVDLETLTLSTDLDFIDLIERSRARYPAGSGVPIEDVRRQFALDRRKRRPRGRAGTHPSPAAQRKAKR